MILISVDGRLGNVTDVSWLTIPQTVIQPVFLFMLLRWLRAAPQPEEESINE